MSARLFRVVLVVIALGIAGIAGDSPPAAVADAPWYDITDNAVQTFYQDYVPQTDRQGNVLTDYGPSSFLPLGIYYPESCTSDAPRLSAGCRLTILSLRQTRRATRGTASTACWCITTPMGCRSSA